MYAVLEDGHWKISYGRSRPKSCPTHFRTENCTWRSRLKIVTNSRSFTLRNCLLYELSGHFKPLAISVEAQAPKALCKSHVHVVLYKVVSTQLQMLGFVWKSREQIQDSDNRMISEATNKEKQGTNTFTYVNFF